MPPFEKHVFVCLHERPDGPRGSCVKKGSEALLKALKGAADKAGLAGRVRVQKSGCLDNCEGGCTVVVYPEGVWYGHVTEADVGELVEQHLKQGRPVERLRVLEGPGER
jgi:(2Fe-2S) ferredoxin